jgi:protein-disulfide isomerase
LESHLFHRDFAVGYFHGRTWIAQSVQTNDQLVLDELRRIRSLLERLVQAVPPVQLAPAKEQSGDRVTLTSIAGYSIGRPDAPLTIVEFTDLQCPFCSEFHQTTFAQLQKEYIETGKVRYVSRDLPLPVHPMANTAAVAARCAGEQGQFWEMRHTILANNSNLGEASFEKVGDELGLDVVAFRQCLKDGRRFEGDLQKDRADAERIGVNGTPSFVLGRMTSAGLDGVRIVGALPYASMDSMLKKLLETIRTAQ